MGHRLKYFAFFNDRPVAALSLKLAPRDCFIGWSTDQRKRHLHQLPANSRFLLIPWLCIAFLPLLYIQTSRNPKTMILAIFSSIFLIALLQLDAERQAYDFSSTSGCRETTVNGYRP